MFWGTFVRPHFVCHLYPLGCCDYVTIYPCFVLHTKFVLEWSDSFFNSPLDVWVIFLGSYFHLVVPTHAYPVDCHMRKGSIQCFLWFIWCSVFMLAPLLFTLYSRWPFISPKEKSFGQHCLWFPHGQSFWAGVAVVSIVHEIAELFCSKRLVTTISGYWCYLSTIGGSGYLIGS